MERGLYKHALKIKVATAEAGVIAAYILTFKVPDAIPAISDPMEKPEWPVSERAKWLQTAVNIFDFIYKGEGGITVTAEMAQSSPRPGEH